VNSLGRVSTQASDAVAKSVIYTVTNRDHTLMVDDSRVNAIIERSSIKNEDSARSAHITCLWRLLSSLGQEVALSARWWAGDSSRIPSYRFCCPSSAPPILSGPILKVVNPLGPSRPSNWILITECWGKVSPSASSRGASLNHARISRSTAWWEMIMMGSRIRSRLVINRRDVLLCHNKTRLAGI